MDYGLHPGKDTLGTDIGWCLSLKSLIEREKPVGQFRFKDGVTEAQARTRR